MRDNISSFSSLQYPLRDRGTLGICCSKTRAEHNIITSLPDRKEVLFPRFLGSRSWTAYYCSSRYSSYQGWCILGIEVLHCMLFFLLLLLRCFSLSSLSTEISDQLSAQLFSLIVEICISTIFLQIGRGLPTTKSLVFHRKRTNADLVVALVFSFFFYARYILYIIFHCIFGEIIYLKS